MSIGVVIGGAFGAIVTALTNIFLSICTWTVPGGLKGLITVLPAMSDSQAGIKIGGSYIQQFATANLNDIVNRLVQEQGLTEAQALSTITSKYTLHGSTYVFNGAAIIDWGTFINAIISFIIIALVLFIIIKIFAKLQKTRAEMHAKAMEEYYKKHPEERPAPAVPGIPEPTDHQLLKGILAELQAQNKSKNTKKK
ncbi:MAG: MscL family protein [Bacilli bacterium]|nr:MscL family protein [Bacilli bacterium]